MRTLVLTQSQVSFLLLGELCHVSFGTNLGVTEGRGTFLGRAIAPACSAHSSFSGRARISSFGGKKTLLLFSIHMFKRDWPPCAEAMEWACHLSWLVKLSYPSHGHCNLLKDAHMKVLPRDLERATLFLPGWLTGGGKPPAAWTILWTNPASEWNQRKSVLGHRVWGTCPDVLCWATGFSYVWSQSWT